MSASDNNSCECCHVQYLGCHVTFGSDAVVESDIDGVHGGVVTNGQTQIANGAGSIRLDQDVLRLQVAMCNCRFTFKIDSMLNVCQSNQTFSRFGELLGILEVPWVPRMSMWRWERPVAMERAILTIVVVSTVLRFR